MNNIKKIVPCFFIFLMGMSAVAKAEPVALTRQEAVEAALANNNTYRAAMEDSAAAKYQYRASWGSFLPTGDLRYSVSDTKGVSGRLTQNIYTAEAALNLFNGLRTYTNMRTYHYNYASVFETERETRLRTVQNVNVAYQSALKADYIRKSSRTLFESAEMVLQEAELKLELGALTRMDLYQATADRERAYTNLLDAELSYSEAVQEIARLTGINIGEDVILTEDDRQINLLTLEEYLEIALQSNPALARACYNEKTARLKRASSAGTFLPTVSAFANTNWNDTDEADYNSHSAGISASWNLFSGFSDMNSVLADSRSLNSARLLKAQEKIDLTHQIETALRQVVVNSKKILSSEAYVKAATENYIAVQEMFRIGRSTLKDTIDARATLQDAQATLAEAQYNTVRSYEELNFLIGGHTEDLRHTSAQGCYE